MGILFVQNNQTVSTTLTISASPTAALGNYTIVLVGSFNTPSGTPVGHALNVTFTIAPAPDFALIANPPTLSIVQDSSGTSTLNVTSLHSFAGTVTLTSTMSLQGPTVSIANSTIAVTAGRTTLTTLTVSAGTNVIGYFSINVTATGGGITHSVNVQLYIAPKPDFSLSISPSSLTVQAGSSGSTVLSVKSLNGFTGPVELLPTISAAGVIAAPSVSMVSLSAGGTAVVNVTVSAAVTTSPGTYTIGLFASSTAGSHSATMSVTVLLPPDFTLTTSASGLIIASGFSAASTISVSPIRGFTGPVLLLYNAPAGITAAFSPNPVLGGSGVSTLTISVASTVQAGNYNVTVVGSGGSFAHTVAIPIIVSSTSVTSLTESRVSWGHRLSLSRNGGVETWTMTVSNTGQSPSYVQVVIAGTASGSNQTFTLKTSVTLLRPGASLTVTLSQPFTSASVGLRYSFAINLQYGSGIDSSANIIKPTIIPVTKGTFSIVA